MWHIAQTAEHILQDCPLHAELRQQTWPKPSTLDYKLNGTEYNLTQTVEFIEATGLQIWQDANIMGMQKKKKKGSFSFTFGGENSIASSQVMIV